MITSSSARTTDATRRLRKWLGLERNIVVLLTVILLLATGEELWARYVPKYLEVLGASAWAIGFYGALKDLVDGLYQYPGGWAADRLGRRTALVVFAAIAICGYGIYLVAPSWEWVLIGTLPSLAWSTLTLPACIAIVGDELPQDRRAISFGLQSVLRRAGTVIGPPLGGALIVYAGLVGGMRLGLAFTIALALGSIGIIRRFYVDKAPVAKDKLSFSAVWREMDPGLKRLLLADSLARWSKRMPKVFIILYVTNVLGRSVDEFGWLTSVQMLSAALVYLPVAKLSDRVNRKPIVLVSFALFAIFPLALLLAAGSVSLVLAFILAGLRELGDPASTAMVVDLGLNSAKASSVGCYYFVRQLVVFPAALVGGWLWTLDPRWPFYAAFLIGVAGFAVYAKWGADVWPNQNAGKRFS